MRFTGLFLCFTGAGLAAGCRTAKPAPGSVATSVSAPSKVGEPRPLNVLLILADDQGCGEFGFMGNPKVKTPNIDALAASGTVFDRFFVSPVCSPTRASLLTGRYHQRTGVYGVVSGNEYMAAEEVTLAEMLQPRGYRTALVGKWHLGENYPLVPHAQGFDEFFGFRDGSNGYFDAELEENGRPVKTTGYLTDVLTDRAMSFVEKNKEKPFFLYLAYNAPHGPLEVPERYVRPHADQPPGTAKLYGMVESLDENVGRLMSHLDRLGLSERTLVIYTSDNGGLPAEGDDKRYNCGQREWKYSVLDGGVRIPLIMRLPGFVPAGEVVKETSAHIDLVPTITDLLRVPLPASLQIDGRSLKPALSGESLPTRTVFMHYPRESNTKTTDALPGAFAIEGAMKLVQPVGADKPALYDLNADIEERHDLAAERPEIAARLEAALRQWWQKARAERRPQRPIPVAYREENPTVLPAHPAKLEGDVRFQYRENPPMTRTLGVHSDWITGWKQGPGTAAWAIALDHDATLAVTAQLRCSTAGQTPNLRVSAGSEARDVKLSPCQGVHWERHELGRYRVPAGDGWLRIEAQSLKESGGLSLRRIEIEELQ